MPAIGFTITHGTNQAFAQRYFPGDNALGKRFERLGDAPQPFSQKIVEWLEIAKYKNVREPATPIVYAPLRKATVEVRAAGDPLLLVPALRDGIRMAFGAGQSAVVQLVMTDVTLTALVGVAMGLAGGLALARLVSSLLFEVKPVGVDPMVALRVE